MLKQKNSKIQANIGLGIAIAYFTMKGNIVCVPLTDSQEYDLVVEINGLKKIQVKTTRNKNPTGNYVVELRTKTHWGHKSYSVKNLTEDIDYVFVLAENGKKYLIPRNKINSRSSITLTSKFNPFLVK